MHRHPDHLHLDEWGGRRGDETQKAKTAKTLANSVVNFFENSVVVRSKPDSAVRTKPE
jgi:hypothetical protein